MFKFLLGVAFGAAGYWAWQSFGRDLLGMGGDQDTAYGSFNTTPSSTSFSSGPTSTPSTTNSTSSQPSTPSTTPSA
jgi:hypothetical protein